MPIEVMRGPKSAPVWSGKGWDVKLRGQNGAVELEFELSASGPAGTTQVRVRIEPDKFRELAQAMITAKPRTALMAFGKALQTDAVKALAK